MFVEWFLYGKISILSASTVSCTLAKEVQIFPGLGIYSGIFAIYLQYALTRKESRTATIVFYGLCLLYVLSTVSVVSDLLANTIEVSNKILSVRLSFFLLVMQFRINTLPVQLQIDSNSLLFRLLFVQITINGCCDLIAQCSLVRINHCTYHLFYSSKSSKDLPLLDHVG